MKVKVIILAAVFLFAGNLFAQGGKAEPLEIKFAKGKSSAAVSGKIYGDLQAEYVFSAKEGQNVRIAISSIPMGKYSAFKVLNGYGQPGFSSESDINYSYSFKAPYTGQYLVYVSFRPAGKVKSAKYKLSLSVR